MAVDESSPDDNSHLTERKSATRPAGAETADKTTGNAAAEERAPVKWVKGLVTVATAIVAIGGAITLITQYTDLLGALFHSASAPASQFEVSPVLGASFHQNGQLDPMSLSSYGTDQLVDVAMQRKPFELWFPALTTSASAIEVCASPSSAVFNNVGKTGQNTDSGGLVFTCLTAGTGLADFTYGSGVLVLSYPPDALEHMQVYGTRAQPASGGDEKYYVSTLVGTQGRLSSVANQQGQLYVVVYRNTNNDKTFQAGNVEYFALNFG